MIKRLFDICAASIVILLTSPIMAYAAIRILIEDGRPILYPGLRVGKHGNAFRMLKFRTMVKNADKIGGPSTASDDSRITKVGAFLRAYKLDELPQLINVIKGDMSLVGPRPEVKHYVDMLTEEEQIILSVRPGITDWASLWNADEGAVLAGSPDPEQAYMEKIRPTKIRLQMEYAKNRSFSQDLLILGLTVLAVATGKRVLPPKIQEMAPALL